MIDETNIFNVGDNDCLYRVRFGECAIADRKALEAFDRAWGEAGEKGDRNALTAILADDYAGLPGMQNKMQNIEAAMATAEYNRANPNMADKVSHDNYQITCTPVPLSSPTETLSRQRSAQGERANLLDAQR